MKGASLDAETAYLMDATALTLPGAWQIPWKFDQRSAVSAVYRHRGHRGHRLSSAPL
jgi:hypothetical protein